MRRAGPLALALLLGACESRPGAARRSAADEGYLLGEADAVKQLYWARQELEAPGRRCPAGTTQYYNWEESGTTRDGRKLAPQAVAVPAFVPAPVP